MLKIQQTRLDHESVAQIWKTSRNQWFSEQEADLSAVKSCDSSAVALLVKWAQACQGRNQRLVCLDAPAMLKSLVRMYGVETLMEFKNNG